MTKKIDNPMIDLDVAGMKRFLKTKKGKSWQKDWIEKSKKRADEAAKKVKTYEWHCPGCCSCRGTF